MASYNKVILLGNLTREPALRYTAGGTAVCDLGLAVNRRFGNEKEETTFVDVVAWAKLAETCERYLEKGNPLLVEGRLQLDQWEDKNSGQKRSKLRVVAEKIEFMRGVADGGGSSSSGKSRDDYDYNQDNSSSHSQQGSGNRDNKPSDMPSDDTFDVGDEAEDDIPF